jgi:hypothetical protein
MFARVLSLKNGMVPGKSIIKQSVQKEIRALKTQLGKDFDSLYSGAMQSLEMDNIRKHEHPVITELGLGAACLRQSYP